MAPGEDAAAPAVRVSGLGKVYRGRAVLDGVDLEVATGERFCLVGRNGSGKSTLLEIVMGLKTATRGEVSVLGRHPLDRRLRGERAMLMDRAVFPYYAKVREVVWLYAGFYPRPLDGAALLKTFELDPGAFVRHLSKGQNQRLGMLLAVLGSPRLILLDEPTSGLDPQGRLLLWETFGRTAAGEGRRTLLFATHDLVEAERWADRVAIVHGGKLVAVGEPADLCRRVVGTRRKLTLLDDGRPALGGEPIPFVASVAAIGPETALYTDAPEEVLRHLDGAASAAQIRIENTSLRDVYFKLTGEVPDGPATVAA
jgi:ABC-2 type transport system ATP-binding protein